MLPTTPTPWRVKRSTTGSEELRDVYGVGACVARGLRKGDAEAMAAAVNATAGANRLTALPDADILYVLQREDAETVIDSINEEIAAAHIEGRSQPITLTDDLLADIKETMSHQDGYWEWFEEAVRQTALA